MIARAIEWYLHDMGKKAGALLWNRMALTLPPGIVTVNGILPSQTDVDTLITQPNRSFDDGYSPGEPPLSSVPFNGSRVQVMPLAPTAAWGPISHNDPFLDATTDTVHVVFLNGSLQPATINVLFWDPHSMVGPGKADTYNPPPPVLIP